METITNYLLLFIIYTIIGYFCEVITCTITDKKLSFFRGFLIGPWIPIYGYGAILMVILLSGIKNYVLLFLVSMLLCSILEYLTSYVMEKIYKMRWWDYSQNKFNLNGRICLLNAILFGIGGVIVCAFANPIISKYINMIPFNIRLIITSLLVILFIIDTIVSNRIVNKLKKNANKYSSKDATEEIKSEILYEVSVNIKSYTRILKAFPNAFKENNHRFDEFNNYLLLIKTGFVKVGKNFKLKMVDSYLNKRVIKDLNKLKKDFYEEFNEVKKEYNFFTDEIHGFREKVKKAIHFKK